MPPRQTPAVAKKVDNTDDLDEEAKRAAQKSPTAKYVIEERFGNPILEYGAYP